MQAIAGGYKIDFDEHPVACNPSFIGNKLLDNYTLKDVLDYIDWNPFFQVHALYIYIYEMQHQIIVLFTRRATYTFRRDQKRQTTCLVFPFV